MVGLCKNGARCGGHEVNLIAGASASQSRHRVGARGKLDVGCDLCGDRGVDGIVNEIYVHGLGV